MKINIAIKSGEIEASLHLEVSSEALMLSHDLSPKISVIEEFELEG